MRAAIWTNRVALHPGHTTSWTFRVQRALTPLALLAGTDDQMPSAPMLDHLMVTELRVGNVHQRDDVPIALAKVTQLREGEWTYDAAQPGVDLFVEVRNSSPWSTRLALAWLVDWWEEEADHG